MYGISLSFCIKLIFQITVLNPIINIFFPKLIFLAASHILHFFFGGWWGGWFSSFLLEHMDFAPFSSAKLASFWSFFLVLASLHWVVGRYVEVLVDNAL